MSWWSRWWSLPGPASFIASVVDDVRDGKNVVLEWPEHGPRGWWDAVVGEAVNLREMLHFNRFDEADVRDLEPELFLSRRLGVDLGPVRRLTAASLAEHPEFVGRLIVIDGVDGPTWPKWRAFLTRYADAARSVDAWRRTRFFIALHGPVCLEPIAEEVGLARHRWDGVTTALDFQLAAAYLIHHRPLRKTERQLVSALLTNLAGWDPHLLIALSQRSVVELAEPEAALQEFAARRGWSAALPDDRDRAWAMGLLQRCDGADHLHPSLVGAGGEANGELDYRLWAAQLAVFLPLVERERRRLLGTLAPRLRIPHRTPQGELVENLLDLEIGQIWHQMCCRPQDFVEHERTLVDLLKEVRNELAHFAPMPRELLERCLRRLG